MSEDQIDNNEERDEEFSGGQENQHDGLQDNIIPISGMYKEYFLDYASYVILERAVPVLNDGLKPVQRRILHSMRELEDGRYNKVANVIGNTMKYHPHGDASIGDAMVQIGQKDLLIDTQGNWGNIFTGDRSAAPRYIEARLSKFALDVVFNPKTTDWQLSYDGRNKEPITLPVKFPLVLVQGVEGIAVGLACKILPHNFNELIDASVAYLKGRSFKLLPDFLTGGQADFSDYNNGLRGGKVKVRAKIEADDKKTLKITEIPFGTTTTSLIDSILKANSKGKIKIKKVEDNTAEHVEIIVHLNAGYSPDKMIDALYAFSNCEVSISPNACVIHENKPLFIGVSEILKRNTEHTKELLNQELLIKKQELETSWHFASLEKIFIENRIYRDIEECETWEDIIATIHKGLKPHIKHLKRAVTDEDVARLVEIKIKRITKFDSTKADNYIASLEDELKVVQGHLDNIVEYAVDFFKRIKKKYGEGRERKTEIKTFGSIERTQVAVANQKLYVDRAEGFVGTGLKKSESEFVGECSDIDDVIVIRKDGVMMVTRMASKTFVGKDIIHVAVWKKGDARTTYNMVYKDGASKKSFMKRFQVTSITRDKEYPLTKGASGSEVHYLSVNPNGEAETVLVQLKPVSKVKKLKFELDFSQLAIKGRGAGGNTLTKYPVKRIEQKEKGLSTLGALKIWYDDSVSRLNKENRGELLGEFHAEDKILTIMQSGHYKLYGLDVSAHFDDDLIHIEKFKPNKPISCVYFDGDKQQFNVKRFLVEETDKKTSFISEHEKSYLEVCSTDWVPRAEIVFRKEKGKDQRENQEINLAEFIAVKGLKAVGNRLTTHTVNNVNLLAPLEPNLGDLQDLDQSSQSEEEVSHPPEKNEEEKKEKSSAIKPIDDDDSSQISLF